MRVQQDEAGSFTLHLLDSAQGHAIQTWRFENRVRVSIGRAVDNDITLADTQVSRLHLELIYREGQWLLCSHGRNGTRIDGAPVTEVRLADRTVFQLGSSGPTFQFLTIKHSASGLATIDNIDPGALDFLVIDEQRKTEEVQRIAEGEAFRQLQEQARRFRRGDGNPSPDGGP